MKLDYSLNAYDYELPEELIAQNPVVPRDSSRLLVADSTTQVRHLTFRDLPDLLQPGDLLVLNHTRVISARLYGRKTTGAEVEILLLEERQHNCWLALVKPGKRFNLGAKIEFEAIATMEASSTHSNTTLEKLTATVVATDEETGGRLLQFQLPEAISLLQILDRFGHLPFPPYVTDSIAKPEQYQTVYAKTPGAVAAPTAGLHFTKELFDRLQQKGIDRTFVTLHVGVGTFRPVEVEEIASHRMHSEWIEVDAIAVDKICQTKARGGRVIAVGTTVVRALEGAARAVGVNSDRVLLPFSGYTDLFIYPGYRWRVVEGLITNFHLPRSSLLMLVSAAIGRERLLELYREAIALRYRFYSFGDAMLILPSAWNSINN
ncbi:MAG: tRNA preQ1(34) S-adenosylmethionine ribosyltransferase-isomerase QueA [Okeania sp. SIO2H7]|nr:tRNA preQ1(34) S-adenosylmethionine ribosyltransferase-isomerase QueA [Okeania sp. SIO2H7]